jgi:hypothetical protein
VPGDLYVWGANVHGVVPGAPRGVVAQPTEIAALRGKQFRSVALSERRAGTSMIGPIRPTMHTHTHKQRELGAVVCRRTQTERRSETGTASSVKLLIGCDGCHDIDVCAYVRAAAVDADGTVYEWGAAVDGGAPVASLRGADVIQVVCGREHTFALDRHVRAPCACVHTAHVPMRG